MKQKKNGNTQQKQKMIFCFDFVCNHFYLKFPSERRALIM